MPKKTLNAVICASFLALAVTVSAGDELTFTRVSLKTVEETNGGYVALADLNGDGTADLVAGLQWFGGPSWPRHPFYATDANTLIATGKTVPYDVDGDGDMDLVLRGLGLGGKYVIGTRQTDVTVFVQQGK